MPDRTVIEELERLLGEATAGPWEYQPDREGSGMGWVGHQKPAGRCTVFHGLFAVLGDSAEQEVNAHLIAAMKNALPALLECARAGKALYAAIGNYTPPAQGFLTDEMVKAGERWVAAIAALESLRA